MTNVSQAVRACTDIMSVYVSTAFLFSILMEETLWNQFTIQTEN